MNVCVRVLGLGDRPSVIEVLIEGERALGSGASEDVSGGHRQTVQPRTLTPSTLLHWLPPNHALPELVEVS